LADQLAAVQDRLPELLALSLRQPALPAQLCRTILTFLAGAPSAEEIAAFAPPPEAQQRLQALLDAAWAGTLTAIEQAELDALERVEHLVILLKSGALPTLVAAS
jgi:capsule polysaccharide export protein KpsE/RkpR